MITYIFPTLVLAWLCVTSPADFGIRFDKRYGALPTLTLPYGTWKATKFDLNGDVSVDSMLTLNLDRQCADLPARYTLSKTFALGRLRLVN